MPRIPNNHPSIWPKPELLQRECVGVIGTVGIWVEPISDSEITRVGNGSVIRRIVHLRVVSEIGCLFNVDNLKDMALNPENVNALWNLCARHSDSLRIRYLPSLRRNTAVLGREQCFVDEYGEVIVTMILHDPVPFAR